MPDHVHLIIYPKEANYRVAQIRKAIKEPVGRKAIQFLKTSAPQWLQRVTRRRGERTERLFWQSGGGFDRNIFDTTALLSMITYIHMNPVRKGLVDRAVDWRWSSAAWYELQRPTPVAIDPIPAMWLEMDN